jgi:hypothetical protein
MTDPRSIHNAQVSYLIWIAEVPVVVVAAVRLAAESGEPELAIRLGTELEAASTRAQERLLARKAFHFSPSGPVAELTRRAVESARGAGSVPPTSLGIRRRPSGL